MSTITIGTTSDALSLARANKVAASLSSSAKALCEVVTVPGGRDALRSALADGTIDVVVSSAADTDLATGPAVVGAYLKRGDSRDALCAGDPQSFDTLPEGARIVVASPLRRAQVLARRPDLSCELVEADVAELLSLVSSGDAVGTVVAAADLDALHRLDAVSEYLGNDGWPTEPGQGSLALEVRTGSEGTVRAANHGPSRTIAQAERGVRDLVGSAGDLLGIHGLIDDGLLFLSARVYHPGGTERVTSSHALYVADVPKPAADIASRVATELLELGAVALAAGESSVDESGVDEPGLDEFGVDDSGAGAGAGAGAGEGVGP